MAVAVVQAALGYLLAGLGGCLLLLADDLGRPRASLSWLSEGFGAFLVAMGVAGAPVMRLGAYRVLRAASLVLGAGAALLALASATWQAQLGAALFGAGGAGVVLASPGLLSGPEAAARLAGAVAASSLAGVGAPFLLSQADVLTGHGRLALLLAVPPLAWAALRRAPPPAAGAPGQGAGAAPEVPGRLSRWSVAGRWLLIVAVVSPEFAFVVWGAARLQDGGLSRSAAIVGAAAFPVGMGLGRVLAPHVLRSRARLAAGIALAMAAGLCAAAEVRPALLTAALLAAGLGIAPLYPFTLARLMRAPGLPLGRAAALGSAASGTAVLAAPRALALVAAHVPLRHGFLVVAPLLALALVAALRAPPPRPAP